MRCSPWLVAMLIGCPGPDEPDAPEPLEVHLEVWCADVPCTTLTATAVADSGRPDAWSWSYDDEEDAAEGETVDLPLLDGLTSIAVEASDVDGQVTVASGAVSVTRVGPADAPSGDRVVFVPFSDCADIPVVSIGGCITGGGLEPLTVQILSGSSHTVSFDRTAFLTGAPDPYTSDQPSPHAVWRVGDPLTDGQAPGTSPSAYYTPAWPAPANPSAEHFTFYVDGVVGGTVVLVASHGPPGSEQYAQHELAITCDADGRIERIVQRPAE